MRPLQLTWNTCWTVWGWQLLSRLKMESLLTPQSMASFCAEIFKIVLDNLEANLYLFPSKIELAQFLLIGLSNRKCPQNQCNSKMQCTFHSGQECLRFEVVQFKQDSKAGLSPTKVTLMASCPPQRGTQPTDAVFTTHPQTLSSALPHVPLSTYCPRAHHGKYCKRGWETAVVTSACLRVCVCLYVSE